jgi:cytochrome P450
MGLQSSVATTDSALALRNLPGFATALATFSAPMPAPKGVPPDLRAVVDTVQAWQTRTRDAWTSFDQRSVFWRAIELGVSVGDALRLQRAIRTRRIDQWLASAPAEEAAGFEAFRAGFFRRCDALAGLVTQGLVSCGLAMPEDGVLAMAVRNPARVGRVLAGRRSPLATLRATASVWLATAGLVAREWDFFGSFFARQLRRSGVPFGTWRAARRMRRLNVRAGRTLITFRHTEPLIAAYQALRECRVTGKAADRIVRAALEMAEAASGKPWKGLTRLYEVLVYSGDDPRSGSWDATFTEAMTGAVEYTHVPGREWIIRDPQLGRRLMQIDGKVAPGDQWAGIQQGRGSLATGYLRGGQDRIAFADRYSKPMQAFLDSMVVAEGADHQRMRKAFLPFFAPAAVLAEAAFVEDTVAALLDQAAAVARRQKGRFDFRSDFAYHFPIRIICHLLELPPADVPKVQHWAETSVRAMDTEAGVGFQTALAGQRASDELRAYLVERLTHARSGTFRGHIIGTVAQDPTLSEAERVANLGVVIFAGFETTTGLLSKGVETLLRHPDQWAFLRDHLVSEAPATVDGEVVPDREWRWLAWARTQPERTVDRARRERLEGLCAVSAEAAGRCEAIVAQEAMLNYAVEELLRWTTPGTVVPLTASKDVAVTVESPLRVKGCPHPAGRDLTITRGETVAVAVDELNRRCPVGTGRFAGATPARFDVTRQENTAHLSFGLRHSCIGAFLAKENAKRALEAVLRRFPDLELAGDPIPQEMELFSGLASLPVRSRATGAI